MNPQNKEKKKVPASPPKGPSPPTEEAQHLLTKQYTTQPSETSQYLPGGEVYQRLYRQASSAANPRTESVGKWLENWQKKFEGQEENEDKDGK